MTVNMSIFQMKLMQLCRGRRSDLYIQKRHVFTRYETFTKRVWNFLQQPLDKDALKMRRVIKAKAKLKQAHRYIPQQVTTLGPDLATAHFVVNLGGAVKFAGSDMWFELSKGNRYQLPGTRVSGLQLEAVDCTNTNMFYESFDNFVLLHHLQYLSLCRCVDIDDWCLDRLAVLKESLLHLDVSGCPKVTERGLASLNRLRKLRRLEMNDLPSVHQPEVVAMMLEDTLPELVVEGMDYSRIDTDTIKDTGPRTPNFIHQYIAKMTPEYVHNDSR